MKVLFINSVVDYGSTGKIVRDLANGLKNHGHEVLLCYGRNHASQDDETFYFGNKISSMYHLLMSRLLGRHGLHSKKETKKLIKKIDDFDPDVIHLHNIHGYYLNYPLLFEYLNKRDIRVLWTLHDCWSFSGSAAHFDYFGCKLWDEGCVICKNTKVYPKVSLFSRQKKNFHNKRKYFTMLSNLSIICPSIWLRDLAATTFLSKYSIQTIYNGINIEQFQTKSDSINKDKSTIKILGVANDWSAQKGLNDFYQLSQILPSSFELTLIGLNNKQIKSIPKNIKGISRTRDIKELVSYYQGADIYINLSVEETMGLTTVEAMAVGTPVIVYDKTAVPEVVISETGIVVSSENFDNLVETILKFDRNQYNRITISNYAKKFSRSNMVQEYLNLYI